MRRCRGKNRANVVAKWCSVRPTLVSPIVIAACLVQNLYSTNIMFTICRHVKHCKGKYLYLMLTRARVAVSATFAMVAPPLTRKLGKLEGRAIRRSTSLSEPVRSHFGHFFAQVNIEVSRGHQRSNFRKIMVLSGMPAIISGTIITTPNPNKSKR